MTRLVIGVDGIDGSGKTFVGAQLVEQCERHGLGARMLRVDDFRRPRDWSQPGRSEADIYYEEYYDLDALDECVASFLDGDPSLRIPIYDPVAERVVGGTDVDLAGVAVVVVEGVFVLRMPTVRRAVVAYVRTSFDRAAERIMARDLAKGRTRAEIERRIRERYVPSQQRYFAEHDPETPAAVVIENDDFSAPRLVRRDLDALPELVRPVFEGLFEPG